MKDSVAVQETPIETYIRDRRSLQTPVVKFADYHEGSRSRIDLSEHYRQLLPVSKPSKGEQYAFEVDLDRCTGCKACVSACHSMNGLDDGESWRDVGFVHSTNSNEPFYQTMTTACHHCADPGCLNGCPTLAYEKDEETGIVRHLDDQCFGCQYCTMKCPYDVPKYNADLGIVRKCDMCYQRLAEGEAPACVQACPTEAIKIVVVNQKAIVDQFKESAEFFPTAPDGNYTLPTTQFKTNRKLPEALEAGHAASLKSEPLHLPLVLMLVLSQFSFGLLICQSVLLPVSAMTDHLLNLWVSLFSLGLAIVSSTSHLGRPLLAWKAFLGLRRSWLSREIVCFGAYAGALGVTLLASYLEFLAAPLFVISTVLGGLSVWTSVMVYHDTQRKNWHLKLTAVKFFGTAFLLGSEFLIVSGIENIRGALIVLLLGISVKVIVEFWQILSPTNEGFTSRILKGPLVMPFALRWSLVALGLCLTLSGVFVQQNLFVWLGFGAFLLSEWIERGLFFASSDALKMPGGALK